MKIIIDANNFQVAIEAAQIPGNKGKVNQTDIYRAIDRSNRNVGFAFVAVGAGFADKIKLVIAVDGGCEKFFGFKVLSSNETPGFGSRIKEDEFGELSKELSEKAENDESITRFTGRFGDIKYEDLVDTVDEWTSRALELDQRRIDVMGVIVKAQNRLLNRRAVPSISKVSSPLTIEDFDTVVIARNGKSGPLVLSPKNDNGLDMPSGMYFCVLSVRENVSISKLIIIR